MARHASAAPHDDPGPLASWNSPHEPGGARLFSARSLGRYLPGKPRPAHGAPITPEEEQRRTRDGVALFTNYPIPLTHQQPRRKDNA